MPIKGSLRFVSAVVLFTMIFQSVFMFAPQRTWAADDRATPYREIYNPIRDYSTKAVNACEVSLASRSIPEILSYALAFGPVRKTLGDYNRFRFVVLRAPFYGLINTPLSVSLSMTLAWAASHAMGGTGHFPNLLGAAAMGSFLESWGSYNVSNIPRDAVTLDKTLPEKERYWLNIWYSAVAYITLTAGPVLAKAHNSAGYNHAMALITFAMIWPFFSRWAGMKITKYLFEGFPKDDELKIFKLSEDHRQDLLFSIRSEVSVLEASLATGNIKKIEELKKKISSRKDALKFASQSREDFLSTKRKFVETAAVDIETTQGLLAQALEKLNWSQNEVRRMDGIATSSERAELEKAVALHRTNVNFFKVKLTQVNDGKRSAEKVIRRLEVMIDGIGLNQDVPFRNSVAMFMKSLGWSTAGAVVMTVIYFLSRWGLVGQSQNDTGRSHPLKHLIELAREHLLGAPTSAADLTPASIDMPVRMASEAINNAQQEQTSVTAVENRDVQAMVELANNLRHEVSGDVGQPLTTATIQQVDDMAAGFDAFVERTLEPAASL